MVRFLALGLAVTMIACSSGDAAVPDGGSDASPSVDAANEGGSDAAVDASALPGACPGTGDPVACDDGSGSLGMGTACPISADAGTATAGASYHLQVSGSKFATAGVCVYITASTCTKTNGDVLQFSGSGGTMVETASDPDLDKSPGCFRVFDVKWDTDWEDDGMTTGGPAGMGGDILAASQKPQAVIEWVHTFRRTSPTTPLCARGGSAGSSALLYQLMHNNGGALLDHVQITSATPFGRIDKGCDPTSPAEGTNVVCSQLPPTTAPQYNSAANLLRTNAHDPNCDVNGSPLATSERAALQAMSLVTPSFTPITLQKTSLTAYMCTMAPNATQGQAVDVFGVNADLATAGTGPYTGLISLDLATPFYACAANTSCPPHIACSSACSTESYGESAADRDTMAADMQQNCVLRH
jgi:hypothetical protein